MNVMLVLNTITYKIFIPSEFLKTAFWNWHFSKGKQYRQLGTNENHANPAVGKDQENQHLEKLTLPLVSVSNRCEEAMAWEGTHLFKDFSRDLGVWKYLEPGEKSGRTTWGCSFWMLDTSKQTLWVDHAHVGSLSSVLGPDP